MLVAVGGLSPCSAGINDLTWPPADDFSDTKPKSAINPDHNNHSMLFQDYSTFPNMGFAHWNQTDDLISGGVRGEISNFNSNGFEEMKNPMNFSCDSSSMTGFKQGNNQDHDFNLLEQNRLNSISCSTLYGYPSTKLLQSLYNEQQQPPPPQAHSFFNSSPSINTNSTFPTNPNDLSLSSSSNFISNYMKSSLPNPPQPLSSGLHFTNNTPFWNAPKSQNSSLALKPMNNGNCEDGQDQPKKGDKNSVTNESAPVFKRPRIETPSPLPTFKVRKEKLGDRVTALQQLVSPFGKTDTASVLHEAIEYIKFLHDQVSVLSTPYMKNNNGIAPIQHQQVSEKVDLDCPKQDLRSRGLCLVPISSTFPVTNTTTTDFWTPAFGGAFQ